MEKKRITVLPHQFNNNDYFLLKFNFDESLVSIARSLGCRWVVSEQGWAIYRSRENLRALIRAFSDISIFDTSKIGLKFGHVTVVKKGIGLGPAAEQDAKTVMGQDSYTITVDLDMGSASAHYLTCDIGHSYVDINASYRS